MRLTNTITMESIDIKCMICHVSAIMIIMILQSKHITATYPLEEDISHLTGIDPPKRWLVFMEIRVRRCRDLLPVRHRFPTDLLSFVRCLTFRYKPQARCLRSRFPTGFFGSRWKIKASVSSSWMLFSNEFKRSKNCPVRHQRYRLLVHKLFGLNLTMNEFTVLDSSRLQPLPGQCRRARAKFIVSYNNGSITYCGKRSPWSIYSNSYMATVELVLTDNSELYTIMLYLRMEVVDPFYSTNQHPSRTVGPSAWGSFKICTYHIAVEMIYRLRILMSHDFQQTTKFKCYDGPDAKMPVLPIYRKVGNQTILISSTFQVVCIFASKSANLLLILHYSSDHPFAATRYVFSNEKVILKNNTGCGNSSVTSWMCIFRIVSPHHTYAQIRIATLHIYGIFANVHTSVGVAIYNILFNKTYLVGHWCYGIINGKNLSFTGSGNQLILSVYAYSPYSLLSAKFSTYASICIGSFIGKRIRPSLVHSLRRFPSKTESSVTSNRQPFYINFDVINHCHAIHISFLPTEYTLEEPSIRIYFKHEKVIRLIRNILGMSIYKEENLFAVTVCGIYTRSLSYNLHRDQISSSNFEITGDIKYVQIDVLPIFGNIPVTIFTVSPTACIQRGGIVIPALGSTSVNFFTWNICEHGWLVSPTSHTQYETKPGASITVERVYGFHPITILVSSFESYGCPKTDMIRYISHGISLHFLPGHVFSSFVHTGEYWRFEMNQVIKVHEDIQHDTCSPSSIPTRVRSWRMHVYIAVSEVHTLSWQQWRDHCAEYGANILTIDDHHELHNFVQNIMLPFAIAFTAIGVIRQVRLPLNSTALSQ